MNIDLEAEFENMLQIAMKPALFELNNQETRDEVVDLLAQLLAFSISRNKNLYCIPVADENNNLPVNIDQNELVVDIHYFEVGKMDRFKRLRGILGSNSMRYERE